MAARKSKFEKQVDGLVEKFYTKHGQGVQIDVMDIGKIYERGQAAAQAAKDAGEAVGASVEHGVESAVIAAIAQFRKN